MTPYYEEPGIQIWLGDCHEILPLLPKVDLVLSDPPYGIGYKHSVGGHGAHNRRNLMPVFGDDVPFDPSFLLSFPRCILWGADHYAQSLPHGRWLAWDKLNGMDSFDSFSDVEFAWDSKPGAARIFRYLWKGILQAGEKNQRREHPTLKPVALMRWCLGLVSDAETVIDPFMGSGTTLVAAKQLGRRAIGIEIEERYCEIAARRIRETTPPLPGIIEPEPEQIALLADP